MSSISTTIEFSVFTSKIATLERAEHPNSSGASLFDQRGVPLAQIMRTYGEHFDFLKSMLGVEIYGNQTLMLPYKIDPARVASSVTPVPLARMVDLLPSANRAIVY